MDAANLDEDENPRKSAALELARHGFAVLAVQRDAKRPDPLLAPDGFKNASNDAATVGGWFDAKPRANVGIACGAEYGLVVLDVDTKNGANGVATLRELWIDTPTLTADTPNAGNHLYFKHPGVPLVASLDGIDIKGAAGAGYVVAPPSTLPNGAYRWRDPEIPIANFPAHLLEELRADKKAPHKPAAGNPAAMLTVPQGKRHKRLVDLGATYRAKGLEGVEITWLLWEHATRYFDPPFSRDNAEHVREVEDVAHWYERKAAGTADTAALHCGAGIAPEPISWLWPGWLAAKKLHVLAGVPGTGKTTIALALAAAVSSGDRWPDGTPGGAPGHVLIWSGEDDLADTLIPRLLAMGAELSRIHFVGSVTGAEGKRPFDPSRDMPTLATAARAIDGKVLLLIVDPIVNAVTGDSHKNVEVRRSLQPLVAFGHDLGAAVLGVSHFSKGTAGKDPLDRITGSLAFGALARLVFGAAKKTDPDGHEEESRVFVRIKSNIGVDGGGFEYRLELTQLPQGIWTTQVTWGKAIEGDARDILGDAEQTEEDYEERSALEDAKAFLRATLATGPVPAPTVLKDAREAGHSERTTRRAKKALKVIAVKDAFKGGWMWELPKVANTSPQNPWPPSPSSENLATFGAAKAAKNAEGCQGGQGFCGGGLGHVGNGGGDDPEAAEEGS